MGNRIVRIPFNKDVWPFLFIQRCITFFITCGMLCWKIKVISFSLSKGTADNWMKIDKIGFEPAVKWYRILALLLYYITSLMQMWLIADGVKCIMYSRYTIISWMAPGAGMLLGGPDTLSAKVTFKCQLFWNWWNRINGSSFNTMIDVGLFSCTAITIGKTSCSGCCHVGQMIQNDQQGQK